MENHSGKKYSKVLITGGAGFIGSYLSRKFLETGAEVHIIDNLTTGSMKNVPEHPLVHFYKGSIMDKPFLDSLSHHNFDLIVHLASIVGMKLATTLHDLVYDTATTGTLNVMRAYKNVPAVLFSSSAVYGMKNKTAVREDQTVSFEQLMEYDGWHYGYANGKWDMEQIGIRESRIGRKVMVVRPFNVIGNGQVETYGMVVPTFVKNALAGKPLTVLNDGNQVRSFSSVRAFSECFFKLIEHDDMFAYGSNVVNIGSPNGSSINDLARIVLEETHSGSPTTFHKYEEFFPDHQDVYYRVPDTSYGSKYFGDVKWPTLRDIVKDIIDSSQFNNNAN